MRHPLRSQALPLGLFILLCVPATVLAQTAPLSYHLQPYAMDSGVHDGRPGLSAAANTAYRTVVEVPGAPWLRLSFSEAALGNGSYLTVTSLSDGAQQRLDAAGLAQWRNTSAFFNGGAVEVVLHVAPGDADVVVRMNEVAVGNIGAPESQCGPTDDRTPSDNPAAGRLLSIGCTAWIIPNGKLVSAGHCLASAGLANVVEFNVPPSLSNGTLQHPGPEDQYTVDDASRQWTEGGIGNDWGVFLVFDNTQTGLQPLEAQGAAFPVVQDLTPPVLRITGYGVDSGSANQTQQTHTGPNAGSSGTTMRYQTDTEGGNSGSPVIDEATGNAVGVHTHGECSTSGGGNNSGTSTFNADFWAALDVAGGGGLEVTCTPVSPPVVVPAGGGSFAYDLEIVNTGGSSQTFDIWVDLTGPANRTRRLATRTLAPGASLTRTLSQRVPGRAPAGTYTLTCNVGTFDTADDSSSFVWIKSATGLLAGVSVADWSTEAELAAEMAGEADAKSGSPAASAAADAGISVLEGNAPNPFRRTTQIQFALGEAGPVRLAVYDLLGREVAVLVDGYREAGAHTVGFDASRLSAGVYVYVLEAGAYSSTRRMTLLR